MYTLHTTPLMRHGDIQDESSKHEQQKVLERCMASRAVKHRRSCQLKTSTRALTVAKRRQLDNMVSTLVNYTSWMDGALVAAEESHFFAPAYIKNLAAVKDNLELVAAATKRYNQNNKEEGTMELKRHAMAQIDDAAKQFAHLRKILDLAGGMIFEMKPSSVEV